ncbi:MAG: 4-(cytidine 5'-diphospho)-2-C-methyl-D-erythritol kinase [Nitrospinae bacterium]|nr:4-(cytidine 5'-diphospho)-2-C-methyl-D-erythritol kinase [Nitrospinota bacterium]
MKTIKIKSPAKINIGLKVVGKRADGYHDIETIFQMIDLCDDIVLTESAGAITLHSDNKDIPTDEKNLAYRAAKLLRDRTGVDKGVRIEIGKHIPISAGLGGGSSNAAAALLGLNYIWDLGLSKDELLPTAKSIGADVPLFLSCPRAMGTGRGDELQTLPVKSKFYVILLNPRLHISTEWVYRNLKLELTKNKNDIRIIKFMFERDEIEKAASLMFNDLESVVTEKYSVIADMKEALLSAGAAGSSMSGSGSTVFGIFKDYPSAEKAVESLKLVPAVSKQGNEKWTLFLAENITGLHEVYPREVIV